ncbi:MAG TPA: cupin domain-containing protein [Pyrinomonadaceae bacterium]|jgi:quercetin dioxygenase-like cupin family protein|nr:cupin domain-containing protein [Pyrinomonadaceae bacterium]
MITQGTPTEALVTDWNKIPVEKIADGIRRQMVVGKNVMVCRFTFDPFVVTDVHSHSHEQITLVIKGRVEFSVDGKSVTSTAGDVLHFPSNLKHGATMLDEEVVLIDIFSPIREDFLNGHSSYGKKS